MTKLYCSDLKNHPEYLQDGFDKPSGCCTSCHEDVEYGYHLMEAFFDDGNMAEVCCRVIDDIDDNRTVPYRRWKALKEAESE